MMASTGRYIFSVLCCCASSLGVTAQKGASSCACIQRSGVVSSPQYGTFCASWDATDEDPWCKVSGPDACGAHDTFQSDAGHYWSHAPCKGTARGPPPLGKDSSLTPVARDGHSEALPRDLMSLLNAAKDDDNRVILAMTNFGEIDLTLNMACSLRAQGLLRRLVVICTDKAAETALRRKNVAAFFDPSIPAYFKSFGAGSVRGSATFHSQAWKLLAVQKLKKIAAVVDSGFSVFFTDIDVVFPKSPMPFLSCNVDGPQMRLMWDGPSDKSPKLPASLRHNGGKHDLTFPLEANGGFIWACRESKAAAVLLDAADSFAQFFAKGTCAHKGAWWCHDQYFVNQALVRAQQRGLKVALFDPALFVNGWVMKTWDGNFRSRGYDKDKLRNQIDLDNFNFSRAVAVHANFCNSKEEKLFVFVKAGRTWEQSKANSLWLCATCPLMRGVAGYGQSQSPFFDNGGNCVEPTQNFYDHCCCHGSADGLCHR